MGAVARAPFLGRQIEGLLESDEVGAGAKGVEGGGLFLELLFGVLGRLDRETDAALDLVDLDDAGLDFVADLDDVFDLGDVVLAELRFSRRCP